MIIFAYKWFDQKCGNWNENHLALLVEYLEPETVQPLSKLLKLKIFRAYSFLFLSCLGKTDFPQCRAGLMKRLKVDDIIFQDNKDDSI